MKKQILLIFLIFTGFTGLAQNFKWAEKSGIFVQSMVVDDSGNIYLTGFFNYKRDFDFGAKEYFITSTGVYDAFVLKLDSSRNFIWAKTLGGKGKVIGSSIKVDSIGYIYVTGRFTDTAYFKTDSAVTNLVSNGKDDIFILKLENNGNPVWAKSMGGNGNDEGRFTAFDKYKNVYFAGYFEDSVDFDPSLKISKLNSIKYQDIFISKFDSLGNFKWAKSIGGKVYEELRSLILDNFGNVIITGWFNDSTDFDPDNGKIYLKPLGKQDIFILKLSSFGNYKWVKRIGGDNMAYGVFITQDMAANSFIAGGFLGTIDFDPGAGEYKLKGGGVFVLKLDSNGNFAWVKNFAGYDNSAMSIYLDRFHNIYLTGYFDGKRDFDPGVGTFYLTSSGNQDAFFVKLDSTGNLIWARCSNQSLICSAFDEFGNIYTSGSLNFDNDFDPGVGVYSLYSGGPENYYISKLGHCSTLLHADKLNGTKDVCEGQTETYGIKYATGAYKYTWAVPFNAIINSKIDTNELTLKFGSNSGYIIAKAWNQCNNSISDTFKIKVKQLPKISIHPLDQAIMVDSNVQFTASSFSQGIHFQWQSGGGNLLNWGQYSGVNTETLKVSKVTKSQNNQKFRCVFTTDSGCSAYTNLATLTVKSIESIKILNKQYFLVNPNPANDLITIQSTQTPSDLSFVITDQIGKQILKGELNNKTNTIDISTLAPGLYFLQIGEANREIFKIVKQ